MHTFWLYIFCLLGFCFLFVFERERDREGGRKDMNRLGGSGRTWEREKEYDKMYYIKKEKYLKKEI